MKTKLLIFAILLGLFMACNKDDAPPPKQPDPVQQPDPQPEPEPENKPPAPFALLSPQMDEENTSRTPTFTWERTTDSDGDAVTYDLYLDAKENPAILIAENLNTTTYKIAEKLDLDTRYFWKVVAKDAKGNQTTSSIMVFKALKYLILKEFQYSSIGLSFEFPMIYGPKGQLTAMRDTENYREWSIFYDSVDRVDKFISTLGVFSYSYDTSGNVERIEKEGDDNRSWSFTYDDAQRISKIVLETQGGNVGIFTLEYKAHPHLPSEIRLNGMLTDLLEWDADDNLTKQVKLSKGKVNTTITYTYDEKKNPWYPIVTEKLRLNELFYYPITTTLNHEHSVYSSILHWVSKNNLQSFESDIISMGLLTANYEYNYNQDGYPISGKLQRTYKGSPENSEAYAWDYLDSE